MSRCAPLRQNAGCRECAMRRASATLFIADAMLPCYEAAAMLLLPTYAACRYEAAATPRDATLYFSFAVMMIRCRHAASYASLLSSFRRVIYFFHAIFAGKRCFSRLLSALRSPFRGCLPRLMSPAICLHALPCHSGRYYHALPR